MTTPRRHPPAARGAALAVVALLAAGCAAGDAGPAATSTSPTAGTTRPVTTTSAPLAGTTAPVPATTVGATTTTRAPALLEVTGPGRYEAELPIGGLVRRFLLVVPESAPDPAPLVLVFHGLTRSPEEIEATSGMTALAEEAGFLVAYPAGTGFPSRWLASPWQGSADVDFARALVAAVSEAVGVDPDRVYAAGFSNGGGMAARLGCSAADVFAAVGPVAAAYPSGPCEPSRPVPFAAVHGTADPIVPYEGAGSLLPAVEQVQAEWARRNGCEPARVESPVAPDVTRLAFTGCDAGADVVLYRVAEGRHGWPGSGDRTVWGATTDTVDAAALLWEFFAAHPMP